MGCKPGGSSRNLRSSRLQREIFAEAENHSGHLDIPGGCLDTPDGPKCGAGRFAACPPNERVAARVIPQENAGAIDGSKNAGDANGGHAPHGMNMAQPPSLIDAIVHHASSGTSIEPNSTPHSMVMSLHGEWMLMFHGEGFLSSIQQSGPRGSDKIISTNWIMPMAQREMGPGMLTVRTMLSLEPATVSRREYPEVFQLGETAYGRPIVDGQHPHDFFMELAALYDVKLGSNALLSFYAAPVGDPAMGPTAYPHRASASEDPLASPRGLYAYRQRRADRRADIQDGPFGIFRFSRARAGRIPLGHRFRPD